MQRHRLLLILVLLFVSLATQAQDIPQVNIPDFNAIAEGNDFDLVAQMTDVLNQIQSLPDDIFEEVGIESETATQLFSYAKWLFSANSANELLGPTLAPIGIYLYTVLGATILLAISWAIIRIALLIFRFVYFIIREVLRVIPFVG